LAGPVLQLHQDVSTRWNSVYDVVERFVNLKPALLLFISGEEKLDPFSSEEWAEMTQMVHILKPLYDVTVEQSTEKHTSISKVIPVVSRALTTGSGICSEVHKTTSNPQELETAMN